MSRSGWPGGYRRSERSAWIWTSSMRRLRSSASSDVWRARKVVIGWVWPLYHQIVALAGGIELQCQFVVLIVLMEGVEYACCSRDGQEGFLPPLHQQLWLLSGLCTPRESDSGQTGAHRATSKPLSAAPQTVIRHRMWSNRDNSSHELC